MSNRIAFVGYARAGKDTAAQPLIDAGYTRACFGDIIKGQLQVSVAYHMGISTFTEDDVQKRRIRGLLEQWGEANYDNISKQFFDSLPEKCVNTRLVRVDEARKWKEVGGEIVLIQRPGFDAATEWERNRLTELEDAGLIDDIVSNARGISDLQRRIHYKFVLGQN